MNLLDQPIGQLAREIPGATQVFHSYQLDFCCGGKLTLRAAAAAKGLDPAVIAERLQPLTASPDQVSDWNTRSMPQLIDHIQVRYHGRHRAQLPELIRLAQRVEQVHAAHANCPTGLADHLRTLHQELESHMQKEEKVLFPILAMGRGAQAGAPIMMMRMEHDQHGLALEQLGTLTNDITVPPGACTTWRALYLGLQTLRKDLMDHIHLENNILFDNVTAEHSAHA